MANRTTLIAVSIAWCLAAAVFAEPPEQTPNPSAPAKPVEHWTFALDEKGNPIFEQFLDWEGDPNALKYKLTIRKKDGETLGEYETESPGQKLSLKPGEYEYRIDTYNILDKIEFSTEWTAISVIEAVFPEIESVSPRNVYIENLNGVFTVTGKKLQDGCVVKLKSASGLSTYTGKILKKKGDTEIETEFPNDAYNPGTYTIEVQNPSGLSRSEKDAVRIRYQKPVDLAIGVGYAAYFPLHDAWSTGVWNRSAYPLGASALADVLFVKRQWGYAGAELAGRYQYLLGGTSDSLISSHELSASVNALVARRITRTVLAVARLGAGATRSYHAFSYADLAGPKTESFDPYARAGISARMLFPPRMYAELGAEYSCTFYANHPAGGITPTFSFGYQY